MQWLPNPERAEQIADLRQRVEALTYFAQSAIDSYLRSRPELALTAE